MKLIDRLLLRLICMRGDSLFPSLCNDSPQQSTKLAIMLLEDTWKLHPLIVAEIMAQKQVMEMHSAVTSEQVH